MAKRDGSSSSSRGKEKMEELMRDLALKEDELDDVVFEEEIAPMEEDMRWMIIVRVHMDKGFST